MPVYEVNKPIDITRTEGRTGDVSITLPDIISPAMYPQTSFVVKKAHDREAILTKTVGGGITITGQRLDIAISADETNTYEGKHLWELVLANAGGDRHTVGRGFFIIKKSFE